MATDCVAVVDDDDDDTAEQRTRTAGPGVHTGGVAATEVRAGFPVSSANICTVSCSDGPPLLPPRSENVDSIRPEKLCFGRSGSQAS